jgi:hypothetical protein
MTVVTYQVRLCFKVAIWHRRLSLLMQGVLLLNDNHSNAEPHTAAQLQFGSCWRLSLHTGPTWPPHNYTFGKLKKISEAGNFYLMTASLLNRQIVFEMRMSPSSARALKMSTYAVTRAWTSWWPSEKKIRPHVKTHQCAFSISVHPKITGKLSFWLSLL